MTTTVEAVQKLRDMWAAERDPLRDKQLERQYQRLSDLLISIADADIGAHAAKLAKASESVADAVDKLEKAIQDNKKVAERIGQVAQAISMLVEVAKLIKP